MTMLKRDVYNCGESKAYASILMPGASISTIAIGTYRTNPTGAAGLAET